MQPMAAGKYWSHMESGLMLRRSTVLKHGMGALSSRCKPISRPYWAQAEGAIRKAIAALKARVLTAPTSNRYRLVVMIQASSTTPNGRNRWGFKAQNQSEAPARNGLDRWKRRKS